MMITPAALGAAAKGDLENFLVALLPGGIKRQEGAGQQELVNSTNLPKEILGATREQLTELGFKFGANVDDLFVQCELPPGWTKRATDHSMHSNLLDEQGRQRAGIFYKAAFYDRSASMRMTRRYAVESWRNGSSEGLLIVEVTDGGKCIKSFGEIPAHEWAGRNALENRAEAWLTEQYPDWNNPLTHW